MRFALERCGPHDALINNAGGQYFTPAEAIEPKGRRAVTRLIVGATERITWLAAALPGSVVTLDGARDNWLGPWPPDSLAGADGDVPSEARVPKPPGS